MQHVAELAVKLGGGELRVDGIGLVVLRRRTLHHGAATPRLRSSALKVRLEPFAIARGGKDVGDPDLLPPPDSATQNVQLACAGRARAANRMTSAKRISKLRRGFNRRRFRRKRGMRTKKEHFLDRLRVVPRFESQRTRSAFWNALRDFVISLALIIKHRARTQTSPRNHPQAISATPLSSLCRRISGLWGKRGASD